MRPSAVPLPTQACSPEANLILGIILQAIDDARVGDPDAWAFLTSRSCSWAQARRDLSWNLGIDPDYLREWVRSTIEPPVARTADTAYPIEDRAIAVIAAEGPMHIRKLAHRAACSVDALSTVLSVLRKRGIVEPTSKGVWRLVPKRDAAAPRTVLEQNPVRH